LESSRLPKRLTSNRNIWALPLLGLLLLGLVGYQLVSGKRLTSSRIMVVHTFEVISAAQALDAAIQDAERGQRGFLLVGEESYLRPYELALAVIPQAIGRLHFLTVDNPDQQARLLTLQSYVAIKLDELKRTIDARRAANLDAALAIVRSNVGETSMQAMLSIIGDIIETEKALLQRRLETAATAEANSRIAMIAGSVAALLILVAGGLVLYRAYAGNLEARQILQSTLDSVREGIGAFDARKRLTAWNDLFVALLGLPDGYAQRGRPLADLQALARGRDDPVFADLSELDRRARRDGRALTAERKRNDGKTIELYHNPSRDGGFVTSFTDVTELRQREAFLQHAQKMDSLGQMTGGVAHDFNNLLTVVVGNLDALRRHVAGDARAEQLVDRALVGAERGAKLNQQLLSFARKQPLEPQVVNLGRLVPELELLLRKSLDERVEIEVIGSGSLWNSLIDPTQFQSAVLNLALNARDAMPEGGKLTLELANVSLDEAYAARHAEVTAGQYVMLAVSDTGTGMPAEIVERAFDPFFTTKAVGKGTGLGLSQVYGFAKQTGGHVKIYSEPGHGTTVKLYLPRALASATDGYQGPPPGDLSGSETILVAEDDDDVRLTVTTMLRDLGYRVLEATNGAAALTILETSERIDMLFTDVVMPGPVTSRVLATAARELRPGIRVLYTSGYTENAIVHNGRLDEGVHLISKPYRAEELAAKLRAVFRHAATAPDDESASRREA
jgi:signal transduction histidine kinase/CheY-like chemotaxis protein